MTIPDWRQHVRWLAGRLADPASRWHQPIADTPRHLLVPRWFQRAGAAWTLIEGAANPDRWMLAAYRDTRSLVTQVGPLHADHTEPDQHPVGQPSSSSTNPWLVMQMYRHGRLNPDSDVLDVGTGSGYGCGLLTQLLGDRVTSIDVDPYLTKAATERLHGIGLHPQIITGDATQPLGWEGDRIVSMVALPGIPASWLTALRTGGRLVTNIAGTTIIITARKTDDGGAWGRVEWDRAGFMRTRTATGYPQPNDPTPEHLDDGNVSKGRFPVINLIDAWELQSVLELTAPGIKHDYTQDADGLRSATMHHSDGSWAIATGRKGEPATVCQGGPRMLQEILDGIRADHQADGYLQLHGAEVRIEPDGTCHFTRGAWRATLAPSRA